MGKYKRLLSNTVILGAGTFTSKVLVFLLMPLYTALLTTEQFGTADILTQTANLLIPLAALGITDGLFRFTLDADGEKRKRIFGGAVAVILLGTIPLALIIQLFNAVNIYSGYVWLIFFYICAANLHAVCANYLRACGKTGIFAIQGIANTVLTIAFNVLFLVVFKMGVTGYVLSVVVSDSLITVMLFFGCRLYRDIDLKNREKGLVKDMLKFSIPYIPTTLMWMITSASDRFIVTAFSGAAENGLYAAAYKLPTLISLAGGVFIEAWQFSSVNDTGPEERGRFFSSVYKNYLAIMFMGTSLLIMLSKVFTVLLLDDSYYPSWIYVPVLAIAMIFSAMSAFMGSVYFLEKRSVRSMVTATAGALINIVLNFMLIPTYGALGAAVATAVSYIAVYVIRALDTAKYLRFDLCTLRVVVNSILLVAQAVIMIAEVPYWILWQIGIVLAVMIINGRDIIRSVFGILGKIFKNKEKNI